MASKLKKAIDVITSRFQTVVGSALAGGDIFYDNPEHISIISEKQQGSTLMNALLRGELTEEVKELADRTYFISEKAKNFDIHISGTYDESIGDWGDDYKVECTHLKADFKKPRNLLEDDKYKVVLVQNAQEKSTGISGSDDDNYSKDKFKVTDLKMEGVFPLKVEREINCKFKVEKFCYQVVLRQYKRKKNSWLVDLYFETYADPIYRIQRMFTNALKSVYEGTWKIFMVDEFKTIEFTTNSAWGNKDGVKYKLNIDKYNGITLHNGFYILTYEAKLDTVEDLTEKFKSETIREKYKNKAKRPNTNIPINPFDDKKKPEDRIEYCEVCNKPIKGIKLPDFYITKKDYGTGMCKACLKKFLKRNLKK